MRIISWNVNGYRAAWKKGIADWLKSAKPDVLCVQETKAWREQLTEEQINPVGYIGNFSQPERKGYSGVATFSKNTPESVEFGLGIDEFDHEGRVIVTDHGEFLLANIYFPNGKQNTTRLDYKMGFYAATAKVFSDLVKSGRKVIVVGDYNTAHKEIDLEHPKAGRLKYPEGPCKFSKTNWQLERPAPLLGEHNEQILCQRLGYSKEELVDLEKAGVV